MTEQTNKFLNLNRCMENDHDNLFVYNFARQVIKFDYGFFFSPHIPPPHPPPWAHSVILCENFTVQCLDWILNFCSSKFMSTMMCFREESMRQAQTPMGRSAVEMENHVYQKAQSRVRTGIMCSWELTFLFFLLTVCLPFFFLRILLTNIVISNIAVFF